MRNILIIFTLFYYVTAQSQTLELSIIGNSTTFEVGQEIELKLSINNLDGQLAKQSGNAEMIIDIKNFEKRIVLICNEVGERSFGPYEINLKNKVIVSNQVSVNIVEPSITNGLTDTIISLAAPEVISKGEKFTIVLTSNIPLNSLTKEITINNLNDLSQLNTKTINVQNNSKCKVSAEVGLKLVFFNGDFNCYERVSQHFSQNEKRTRKAQEVRGHYQGCKTSYQASV